ncbi:hypothetical protein LG284_12810 [Citricoccus nitrophenolicus]
MISWLWHRRRPAARPDMHQQHELVAALDADVDRQLAAVQVASSGITTRASILIGAAGLTSGLQLSSISIVPSVLSVLGALIGVALLMMRTATEVPILEAEQTFWQDSPTVARRNLMHWKLGILEDGEKSLRRRRYVLICGFTLLAGSIVCAPASTIFAQFAEGGE